MADDDDFDLFEHEEMQRQARIRRLGPTERWLEVLFEPAPKLLDAFPGVAVSAYPLSHPWWPEKGSSLNTDAHYDEYCAMYGEIEGYEPSVGRGYPRKRDRSEPSAGDEG